MRILGIHTSFWHDPAAALVIDGRVVAAVEEERISRNKHAIDERPVGAIAACLDLAGLTASDVDRVAYSWSPVELDREVLPYFRRAFWREGRRAWRRIHRTFPALRRERLRRLDETLERSGIPPSTPVDFVEHHDAHAASSFYASGFERAAILSFDGTSDVVTTLIAEGHGREIRPIHRIQTPDSLGLFYSTFTDYLGFAVNDGEYKLMGMAPYGEPGRHGLHDWIDFGQGDLRLDASVIGATGRRRWQRRSFGPALVDRFGPPREGDAFTPDQADLAAEVQRTFERVAEHLIDHHLSEVLAETGRLCLAGGCALNVVLNRKLLDRSDVRELFVPPGPADPGTAIGAAFIATLRAGRGVEPWRDPYLGPGTDAEAIESALAGSEFPWVRVSDPVLVASELLSDGEIVGWFQGRMEWGPRALGHRSLLGHPGRPGTADRMNAQIKFREGWRPFCPSVLAEHAAELFPGAPPSPYMNTSYRVSEPWRTRIPEVVHVDGTARPQTVSREQCERFHRLIDEFRRRTGLPCLMNTSLNRRGEPIVCHPRDALAMFAGSGLEVLVIEDFLIVKRELRRLLERFAPKGAGGRSS